MSLEGMTGTGQPGEANISFKNRGRFLLPSCSKQRREQHVLEGVHSTFTGEVPSAKNIDALQRVHCEAINQWMPPKSCCSTLLTKYIETKL